MKHKEWIYLMIAIASEVFASSCFRMVSGFSKIAPIVASVLGYAASFYCLSKTIEDIPLGIAYTIWCGVGIVAILIVGRIFFNEHINKFGLLGTALIIIGIAILQITRDDPSH